MTQWFVSHLNQFFQEYGYWTVFFGVLLESAGVPVPGETTLILASIFARTQHGLNIVNVGWIAALAAVTGDNIGFAIGHYGGRKLLARYHHFFHIKDETIRKGESLIARRGGLAIYFARFIAALRVLAGPLAGALCMRWRKFLLFNALGAVSWVALITTLGYLFGRALQPVLHYAGWTLAGLVVAGAVYWFIRNRIRTRAEA